MKTIFIFAYYSYKDPVFQSAVLPYFEKTSPNHQYVLLTWEQDQFKLNPDEIHCITKELKALNIKWYRTKWHSGSFKLLKKIYDFLWGYILSFFLIIRHKVKYVYSEGFPGAIIGHYLSLTTKTKHIIHTFEPHAAYMEEAGVWKKTSWEYRLLKFHEAKVAKNAYKIITATSSFKQKLIDDYIIIESKILVMKSCVDTQKFNFNLSARNEIRNELNIKADQLVISYLGKLGGMYMDEELFKFFSHCNNSYPDRFYFMIFNNLPSEDVYKRLEFYNIPVKRVFHKCLEKHEVADYLSAADFGFVGVRPFPSKLFCSPIKNGEYLACGLPLIIPDNVSEDVKDIKEDKLLGICVDEKELCHGNSLVDNLISYYLINERTAVTRACHSYARVTRDINLGIEVVNKTFS